MLKQEYLICMDVQKMLAENVTGSVFTTIINDNLLVNINAR